MNHLFFEGLSLTVESVERSVDFYAGKLGLAVELLRAPAFALLRANGGTIGLLSVKAAGRMGAEPMTARQKQAIHLEFSTENLDALYNELLAKGVVFQEPPHDEPWERAMTALDPDGYLVEIAQGRRGANVPPKQLSTG